jgi:hypothetical protein
MEGENVDDIDQFIKQNTFKEMEAAMNAKEVSEE